MIRSVKGLLGHKLGATDGHIGHIKDLYFDDALWVARYLVADTGSWISGRLVLISPLALGGFEEKEDVLRVNLTRSQIENSPSIEAHKPVSRRYEEEYYQYYNWPFYWQGGSLWGISDFPTAPPLPLKTPLEIEREAAASREDAALNSANSVIGYHVQALDKDAGRITDVQVDDRSWLITGLVIETGWIAGRKTMVTPNDVSRISWTDSTVFLKTNAQGLQNAA